MQLFRWDSEMLRRHIPGDILVMAESEEEAREEARKQFETWLPKGYYSNYFRDDGTIWDEDAQEQVDKARAKFEADIAGPAETGTAFFLIGSE